MTSYRQIEANRRNALNSTGPKTTIAESAGNCGDAGEFATSAGNPTSEEVKNFLQPAFAHIASNVCMDWQRLEELSVATRPHFGKPKNMVVWVKIKDRQGGIYRSQYIAGNTPTPNNFRFRERRRRRPDVWTYAGYTSSRQNRDTTPDARRTPVALIVDALRDCSKSGQFVLDPFADFGTTMIAAERSGRRARLIEIDPIYCDLIVRRWQTISGKIAHLADSNESFVDVQGRRLRAGGDRE